MNIYADATRVAAMASRVRHTLASIPAGLRGGAVPFDGSTLAGDPARAWILMI